MDLILTTAIVVSGWMPVEMSRVMKCSESQEIISRLYMKEDLEESMRTELIEIIMENTEINCPLPQAV